MVETITKGLSSCPDQKYALFGYSQGATLMLKSLAKLYTSVLESVKSVILAGNSYHIPGKISNVDATAQHDEKPSVGIFAEDAISSNSTTPQLSAEVDHSGKVLDYCLEVSTYIHLCKYSLLLADRTLIQG